jgi:hypothetical protein
MSYYVKPWGRTATFVLQDTTKQTLWKADGTLTCSEPFHLSNPLQGIASGYPSYEPITVDGTTEMIEHKKMEPVFYITDDPAVRNQSAATGCR